MSMGQLNNFKGALDLKGSPGLNIGSARDLPRTVGKALRGAQEKKLRWIIGQCYSCYGNYSDGSPLGYNAEAIGVKVLKKSDYSIHNILLSVWLYKSSLSGENIASNLLAELNRFEPNQVHWWPSMMGRSLPNKKAMLVI